jgi:hypothetical protein
MVLYYILSLSFFPLFFDRAGLLRFLELLGLFAFRSLLLVVVLVLVVVVVGSTSPVLPLLLLLLMLLLLLVVVLVVVVLDMVGMAVVSRS